MKYQVQSTGISNFKFIFFAENKQMFIPPKELQEKFQKKVSPLFKQMHILGKQINRLKETRDLVLPKLISGKIDVEEMELKSIGTLHATSASIRIVARYEMLKLSGPAMAGPDE